MTASLLARRRRQGLREGRRRAAAGCALVLGPAARARRGARRSRALDGVSLRAAARRIARRHRRERRGQIDAAQDRRRRDPAHARHGRRQRPRRRAARARLGLPSRVHGLANIDLAAALLGPHARRDRREARRDRRLRRHRRAHPRSDQALLVGHGRAARLRGRDRACARRPHHRRGARGRRRVVPEEVHRVDGALPCATAARCSCARTACTTCRSSAAHALWLERRARRALRAGDGRHAGVPRVPRGEERARRGSRIAGDRGERGRRLRDPVARARARRRRSRRARRFDRRGEVYSPDGRAPVVLVGIVRADGTPVYGVATDMDGVAPDRIANGPVRVRADVAALDLLPGKYLVRAHALDPRACACSTTSSAARRHRRRRARWVSCGSRTAGATGTARRMAMA